jgi:hypothetical protein
MGRYESESFWRKGSVLKGNIVVVVMGKKTFLSCAASQK